GQVISAGGNLYPAPTGATPDFGQVIPAAQAASVAEATVARAGLTQQGHLRFSTTGATGEVTARGGVVPIPESTATGV
ncbi:MAG: hypothetical protein ACK58M_24670, partial [Acidobacteriota bacterium]